MKIAIVTDDEQTISPHFGRAALYLVVTLTDGLVVSRERRAKPGHSEHSHGQPLQLAERPTDEPHHHHDQHSGPAADDRHASMAAIIADCQILLCGGIGGGMHTALKTRGIRPIRTEIQSVDAALAAFAAGTLDDRVGSQCCEHP
ncbi:MAG: hypothetical protein JNL73_15665 [Anaerolineales bacterium]|nr:hypothetical protein [Anaerolineales bacterium]